MIVINTVGIATHDTPPAIWCSTVLTYRRQSSRSTNPSERRDREFTTRSAVGSPSRSAGLPSSSPPRPSSSQATVDLEENLVASSSPPVSPPPSPTWSSYHHHHHHHHHIRSVPHRLPHVNLLRSKSGGLHSSSRSTVPPSNPGGKTSGCGSKRRPDGGCQRSNINIYYWYCI